MFLPVLCVCVHVCARELSLMWVFTHICADLCGSQRLASVSFSITLYVLIIIVTINFFEIGFLAEPGAH